MSSAGGSVKFKYLHSLDTTLNLILVLVLSVNQHLLTVRVFQTSGKAWRNVAAVDFNLGWFFSVFSPFY